jgi:hypothetical protein
VGSEGGLPSFDFLFISPLHKIEDARVAAVFTGVQAYDPVAVKSEFWR